MESLFLFLVDEKNASKLIQKIRNRILKRRRDMIRELQNLLDVKLRIEKAVCRKLNISTQCYYLRMAKTVSKITKTITSDFRRSTDLYPRLVVHKKLVKQISDFNAVQQSHETFAKKIGNHDSCSPSSSVNHRHTAAPAATKPHPRIPEHQTHQPHQKAIKPAPFSACEFVGDDADFATIDDAA